jgi:hypothetical protein
VTLRLTMNYGLRWAAGRHHSRNHSDLFAPSRSFVAFDGPAEYVGNMNPTFVQNSNPYKDLPLIRRPTSASAGTRSLKKGSRSSGGDKTVIRTSFG